MIILNTTFHIDESVHLQAVGFLKSEYIPKALESGLMQFPRLTKIFTDGKEEGHSYSVQFSVADIEKLEQWNSQTGSALNTALIGRFFDKIVGFSTLLQEIEL